MFRSQRMKFGSILVLLAAFGAASADTAETVRCLEVAFSRSAESQSLEGFKAFLDPDARFVGSTVQRGPRAIGDAWNLFFEPGGPRIRWRPKFVEVLDSGELALTRGPWLIVTTNDDGDTTEQWGTFNTIWRLNESGDWKVVFDAGSPAPGPLPANIRELLDEDPLCDEE